MPDFSDTNASNKESYGFYREDRFASFVTTIHWRVSTENLRRKALGLRRRGKQPSVCNEYGAGKGSHTCRFGSSDKSVELFWATDVLTPSLLWKRTTDTKRATGMKVLLLFIRDSAPLHRAEQCRQNERKNDFGGFFRKTTLSFI